MEARLPIDDCLPDLIGAVRTAGRVVLQAPPGAGKTTRVPLALLQSGLVSGRIVMLEPRRLAARAAASRMADTLDEDVGQTVGFRIRGERAVSAATRVEVVTEGILTRMIQSDPSLDGIGAVIFDEFHERSLNADLGLALAIEVRRALREDLRLIVMSATLDAEPVAALLDDAPVVTSEGFGFPVETRWLDRPLAKEMRFDAAVADLIRTAAQDATGGILAFLPGEAEIRRVAARLSATGLTVMPLYGALSFREQKAALGPVQGRKCILATSIAETSLTIPDIGIVVDGGLTRRARYDPGSGMSRLVTERVSRAEADQRKGRAGRVAKGVCYRLWAKAEEGALASFPPAEIEVADLAGLALELAEWGSAALPFLTAPPEAALAEAHGLLAELGALDKGSITDHGRALARMPLHPRLAHMLARAGKGAAPLAALLADRDPMRGAGADLALRLDALRTGGNEPAFQRIRAEARRLARLAPDTQLDAVETQAMLAYPDRIALRRPGDDPRWLLSGGKGVRMDAGDRLANARWLVVTDTDGHPREATVRTALETSESAIRDAFAERIETVERAEWSRREGRVIARIEERLGALTLSSRNWKNVPEEALTTAMLDGVRYLGLSLGKTAERFRARVALARRRAGDLPDLSDANLIETLETWLAPNLTNVRSATDWRAFDALPALRAILTWEQMQAVDRIAPASFETPLGRSIPIDYDGDAPGIDVRLQEMFGVTEHPHVGDHPLRITLLSPASRPVQTTMDLPGFWRTSYEDVRKDMRGRYPKHPWPDDPTAADPTLRAKRRK